MPANQKKAKRVKKAGAGNAAVKNALELRLYVAGQTARSLTALANIKRLCEEHLSGRYTVEVIDLLANPQLARGDQILAVPTLVRKLPQPIKKIIGDLSSRRVKVQGMEAEGSLQILTAEAPARELNHYATVLRSLTGGRGIHAEEFSHYEEMPRELEAKVIEESKKARAAAHNNHG